MRADHRRDSGKPSMAGGAERRVDPPTWSNFPTRC